VVVVVASDVFQHKNATLFEFGFVCITASTATQGKKQNKESQEVGYSKIDNQPQFPLAP